MASPLQAQICDLLGREPEAVDRFQERPPVRDALRQCGIDEVVAARHRAREVAVVRLADGRCYAVEDRCPHDGGRLSDGFVEGDRLVCARHCWEFDLETGECHSREGAVVQTRRLRRR